jgi:ABC-2 type transport system ATP-binding protein
MSALIKVKDLHFSFSKKHVLQGLNLNVPENSIYGFLGANGSGKTTTLRLLLGLIGKPGENIYIFNQPLVSNRITILQRTGALIETPSFYPHLSGFQNLELIRRLIGGIPKKRTDEVLEIVKLSSDAQLAVRKYSLGMKQRLGLAIALINNPELLMLDEPTNGLDPLGIKEMRELFIDLNKTHGKTIFLSSHLLSEIEKIVTHIGILKSGHCVFEGSLEQLNKLRTAKRVKIKVDNVEHAVSLLLPHPNLKIEESKENYIQIKINTDTEITEITQRLVMAGLSVYTIEHIDSNLESSFLELTGS